MYSPITLWSIRKLDKETVAKTNGLVMWSRVSLPTCVCEPQDILNPETRNPRVQ